MQGVEIWVRKCLGGRTFGIARRVTCQHGDSRSHRLPPDGSIASSPQSSSSPRNPPFQTTSPNNLRDHTPLNNYTHKHHTPPSHKPTPASGSPTRTDYRYCTSTTAHSHPGSPASTISRPSGTLSSSSPWSSRSRHRSSRRGRLGCWYPRGWR